MMHEELNCVCNGVDESNTFHIYEKLAGQVKLESEDHGREGVEIH